MRPVSDPVRETARGVLRDPTAATLPQRLDDSGFIDFLTAEPMAAIRGYFAEQGAALTATPALDLVLASALGRTLEPGQAVVHPRLGSPDPLAGRLDAERSVRVDGTLLAGAERAETLVVPVATATGVALMHVDRALLNAESIAGVDPSAGLIAVTGSRSLPEGSDAVDAELPLALARAALAAELLGVAEAILETAVQHVTSRVQFGRPIGALQAVRHQLADVFVALAATRDVLDDLPDDPGFWHGAAVKALAGRCAGTAAAAALQVCGAMGFTDEFGLHRQVRRTQLLDALYGSPDQLTFQIGTRLAADRDVPVLVDIE